MVIAIPTEESKVSAHFGRCSLFTLVTIENGKVKEKKTLLAQGYQHQHEDFASLLKEKGASYVITGGIGSGARMALESIGLKVISGAQGEIDEVIRAFLEDRLKDEFKDKVLKKRVPLYLHPESTVKRGSRHGGDLLKVPQRVAPNIWLSGEIPRRREEVLDRNLYILDENNQKLPDPVRDEICVFLEEESGFWLISGCAHPGLVNIVEAGRKLLDKRVKGLIGGTHLAYLPAEEREFTYNYLLHKKPYLLIGHCTGIDAYCELKTLLPNSCFPISAGQKISLKEVK